MNGYTVEINVETEVDEMVESAMIEEYMRVYFNAVELVEVGDIDVYRGRSNGCDGGAGTDGG